LGELSFLLVGLAVLFVYFAAFWALQYAIGNSAVVDVGWALSVAIVGGLYCWAGTGDVSRRWLAAILIAGWAIRLSGYLFFRWRQHPEDERYTALKDKWGNQAQIRMFRFYQMQALGAFVFTWPLFVVANLDLPLGVWDFAAVAVWIIAIAGGTLADLQLKWFKQNPDNQGQVCKSGLWRYSRHPNYFFEWLHWWAYVLMALLSPWLLVTLIAPLAMWFFLTKVTGIPTTEARAVVSRGDRYREYQKTTNAFFPWFPKDQKATS
jgi:steroid 5-alpha reductase family enzyme